MAASSTSSNNLFGDFLARLTQDFKDIHGVPSTVNIDTGFVEIKDVDNVILTQPQDVSSNTLNADSLVYCDKILAAIEGNKTDLSYNYTVEHIVQYANLSKQKNNKIRITFDFDINITKYSPDIFCSLLAKELNVKK